MGNLGWQLNRVGNVEAATAAFKEQIAIFPYNPEPYASLALLAAAHGDKKEAIIQIRAAVMRGYTDLLRFEQAEVWQPLRNHREFLRLADSIPQLLAIENQWPAWEAFYTVDTPSDLTTLMTRHTQALERLAIMQPALGERYTRLWTRLFDRVAATLLEAYLENRPDAPDFDPAMDQLMTFYAADSVLQWDLLPQKPAQNLVKVSQTAMLRYNDDPKRAPALFGLALGKNAKRDGHGRLTPGASGLIRAALSEILTDYPDSAVAGRAAIGLIRTELETGRPEKAAQAFQALGNAETVALVREDLGAEALKLGGLPNISGLTLAGTRIDSNVFRAGKVTVLDFWATWCGPCVEELPTLRKIESQHGGDVVVLGVNMDSGELLNADALRQWIREQSVPGDHLFDGDGWESEWVRAFGVKEIPFNVIVGPDGEVLAVNKHGKQLEKSVHAALRQRPSAKVTAD